MSKGSAFTQWRRAMISVALSAVLLAMSTTSAVAQGSVSTSSGPPVMRYLVGSTLGVQMLPVQVSWPAAISSDGFER